MVLVVQFLNLVSGAHANSATFWTKVLPDAMILRFGRVVLHAVPDITCAGKKGSGTATSGQEEQLMNLWQMCQSDRYFLFALLPQLCTMTGILLSPECTKQLSDFEDQLRDAPRNQRGPTLYDPSHSGYNVTNITDNYQFHSSGSRTCHASPSKPLQQLTHFEFVMADIREIVPVSATNSVTRAT
jgi:hypothetical protein